MGDEQDRAEALDDDEIGSDFPPDTLLGAQAYGAAGAEPHADENVVARAAREEPEEVPGDAAGREGERVDDALEVDTSVQEREAPLDAEDAAMHLVDEELGGFDSEVDDPQLAEAYEIDEPRER